MFGWLLAAGVWSRAHLRTVVVLKVWLIGQSSTTVS
jgi:hypothetical protein